MQQLLSECVSLVLLLSIVPVGVVSFVAGIVVALQSATQIQEQSVVHLVRIAVFAATVYLCGETGFSLLRELFIKSVVAIELIGRS